MNAYIIRLQRSDDLITVQDKMAWSTSSRIILIFPERARIFSSRIEFARIVQAAKMKGNLLAVVIKDERIRMEAERGGLAAFTSLEKAKRSIWKKSTIENRLENNYNRNRLGINEIRKRLLFMHRQNLNPKFRTDLLAWFILVFVILVITLFFTLKISLPL